MSGLKETIVRTTKGMFRYAAFGVAVCVGTTLLLYRMILEWLQPARSLPPSGDNEDEREIEPTSQLELSSRMQKTSSVDNEPKELLHWHEMVTQGQGNCLSEGSLSHASAEGLRHRHPAVNRIQDNYSNSCQLSYEDAATSNFSDSKPTDVSLNGKEFEAEDPSMLNNNTQDPLFAVLTPPSAEMHSEGVSQYPTNVENWSFSLNTEHSRSCLQESGLSSSVDPVDLETQCPSTVVRKPGGNSNRFYADMQKQQAPFQDFLDHNFSFASSAFSPNVLSYQHSTPDDQQTVAMTSRIERPDKSIFTPVNEHQDDYVCGGDSNDKSFAMNTISLHDFSARESRRSRSCASLDDSMFFVNDLALFDTPCANDICTAVTNLEQLEREVAGVMSDCGEMQRCVGVLRRHDRRDKVAKRYSLGVADSVIAGDARLFSSCNRRDLSLVAEAQNLSNSIGNGQDSGYIWDDDLPESELASHGLKRRSSRSFSLPRSF